MQASAIWRGVTGTLSERPVVSPAPVTAQVMKTSRLGCSPMTDLPVFVLWLAGDDDAVAVFRSTDYE
jgi:hypothetical protein